MIKIPISWVTWGLNKMMPKSTENGVCYWEKNWVKMGSLQLFFSHLSRKGIRQDFRGQKINILSKR